MLDFFFNVEEVHNYATKKVMQKEKKDSGPTTTTFFSLFFFWGGGLFLIYFLNNNNNKFKHMTKIVQLKPMLGGYIDETFLFRLVLILV